MSTVRQIAPPLAAALLAGGALYGLLAAVRPSTADREDPWLEAWRLAGLHVQFRATSTEPSKHLQWVQERERYARPEFAGTKIRSYAIHGLRAQVVELPSDRLQGIETDSPAGDGPFQYSANDKDHHAWQAGRRLLILANRQRVAFWTIQMTKEIREKVLAAFLETVGRLTR